jgi:hypothetical protein
METKWTEQQSLEVINEMINRARNNVQKGSGNYFIFWGVLVAFTALLNLILAYSLKNPDQSFWVWILMIPGGLISYLLARKIDKSKIVKTHIDNIVACIWKGYMFSIIIFLLIVYILSYHFHTYYYFLIINPIILSLIGIAEYVTAKACRFKLLLYGAWSMWIGAITCALTLLILDENVAAQFIILAVCMITGFVIPGYKLNKLAKQHV